MSIISSRYANALSLGLKDQKQFDEALQVLEFVKALFDIEEARKILESPVIPPALKKDLLEASLEKAENLKKTETFQLVKSFVLSLLEQGRLNLFQEVFEDFKTSVAEKKGVLEAQIESVVSLGMNEISSFEKTLSKLLNSKVVLMNKINPKILGGVKITAGKYLIDLSLKSQIESLTVSPVELL